MPANHPDHLTAMGLREAPQETMQPDPQAEATEKPLVTPALVEYLRKQFPVNPYYLAGAIGAEASRVHALAGQMTVIDHLETLIDRK